MKATDIIRSIKGAKVIREGADFNVRGISCNSRRIEKDFVFIAVKGAKEDGAGYIPGAIKKGASMIISESAKNIHHSPGVSMVLVKDSRSALADLAAQYYGFPSRAVKVVGVTGTNGKTTVTYLIESIIKKSGRKPAVVGTINYRFNKLVIPAKNTTPGPLELQELLNKVRMDGADYCVMEVSSHALDQKRTLGVDFHSAIFTNLSQDHLDYHKTMEKYSLAKAKLFNGLKPGAFAVINSDDKFGRSLKMSIGVRKVTYGISAKADVVAKEIKTGVVGSEFKLVTPRGEKGLKVRLIGRHNVYNILAAAAWAVTEGISLSAIKEALENFNMVPGRLQRVRMDCGFALFVDYAHTDDALKNVLNTLRRLTEKRIIVVFGCGGERDRLKRPKMGKVAASLADYCVVTSDNPRSEDPDKIIKDIKQGMRGKNNYCVIPDRKQAVIKALQLAGAGDIVLVAGKGHESYQILKDKTIYFDDCQVVRECWESMNS